MVKGAGPAARRRVSPRPRRSRVTPTRSSWPSTRRSTASRRRRRSTPTATTPSTSCWQRHREGRRRGRRWHALRAQGRAARCHLCHRGLRGPDRHHHLRAHRGLRRRRHRCLRITEDTVERHLAAAPLHGRVADDATEPPARCIDTREPGVQPGSRPSDHRFDIRRGIAINARTSRLPEARRSGPGMPLGAAVGARSRGRRRRDDRSGCAHGTTERPRARRRPSAPSTPPSRRSCGASASSSSWSSSSART